jgi:hypothetical protein
MFLATLAHGHRRGRRKPVRFGHVLFLAASGQHVLHVGGWWSSCIVLKRCMASCNTISAPHSRFYTITLHVEIHFFIHEQQEQQEGGQLVRHRDTTHACGVLVACACGTHLVLECRAVHSATTSPSESGRNGRTVRDVNVGSFFDSRAHHSSEADAAFCPHAIAARRNQLDRDRQRSKLFFCKRTLLRKYTEKSLNNHQHWPRRDRRVKAAMAGRSTDDEPPRRRKRNMLRVWSSTPTLPVASLAMRLHSCVCARQKMVGGCCNITQANGAVPLCCVCVCAAAAAHTRAREAHAVAF